jgi:hypothetical protein
VFLKLHKVNNRPIGENLVTLLDIHGSTVEKMRHEFQSESNLGTINPHYHIHPV